MEKSKVNTRNKRVSMLLLSAIGFLLGVVVYVFDLMLSNAEVSSVEPTLGELVRNGNYVALFVYAIIAVMLYVVIKMFHKLTQ